MAKKDGSKSANLYNIIRICLYIIIVGVPLRYLHDGFGGDKSWLICLLMFAIAAVLIALLELLVFSRWRKKLVTFPAVTQGSMYHRTVGGYRSANDVDETESSAEKASERER